LNNVDELSKRSSRQASAFDFGRLLFLRHSYLKRTCRVRAI
jgi:hypothetical protein